DYVEISDASVGTFGSSDFSVLFWFKADSLGSARYLMGKSLPDFGQGWDIRLDNQVIDVVGVNGWNVNITTSAFATAGTWYHVALVGSATTVQIYVDGALAGSTGRAVGTSGAPFRIGMTTNYGGTAFPGLIDDVMMFDRALSPFEIASVIAEATGSACPVTTTTSTSTTTTTLPPLCADPTGDGLIKVTDCLYILKAAVGLLTCAPECICAPAGTLPATATDALACLKKAVGQAVTLSCPCP
ncbi:MAG: LamG domain-containing protein, partial [Candidatus Dadabacteria bacterium]